jgi:hypothetical protein
VGRLHEAIVRMCSELRIFGPCPCWGRAGKLQGSLSLENGLREIVCPACSEWLLRLG